ncbi:LysR family transcriptional regulator [Pasteurella skyensis]|uniref:LysR family transcriptional regulator n=1 Tax=Phocoenobacter skyensis TaxID=97481 RepID=A0AAJ6N997_9PAST|nr:LysR family transcriptional regulator [Pasteurella skyensis]MDP8162856.1 LysR family transcriptional regulator [Pasteurella skyensis]MDP8172557.1 LysR family transcriptional regulator [Pasteurella skyensis]MDP8177680.1 LysR family transcriptional regulator [Pasteurella skyensis]MDP8179057.1 LysR family transcriptional regulator [Pasteurella skyensis]MDP8183258.1 LysR family transcriptional regulator [Pasteurella skyensis]
MPTIKQLKYVIKIVELGSISEASKQLFVSQPSLSNALKGVEEELNITIFQRSAKGVTLTDEGVEFLAYARQIIDQVTLMETKYQKSTRSRQHLSVSGQHYAFAVHAFAKLIKNYTEEEYEFTLRETETFNILNDVSTLRSELGIIYINAFNRDVMHKIFKEKHLKFTPLFEAQPHIFTSKHHPLANRDMLTLEDLEPYPYLSFEQGTTNSFYFSEEILSTHFHKKSIKVSDRATIFNLMVGVDGYTISSGVLSRKLNDENIISIPLKVNETMTIGYLKHRQSHLSYLALEYLEYLKQHIRNYGFKIMS